MLIAVAALVYCRKLGSMRFVDFIVSLVALGLLVLTTIWLFDSVPAPPQRWFGYYFVAYLAAGGIWFLLSGSLSVQRRGNDDQTAGDAQREEDDKDPNA